MSITAVLIILTCLISWQAFNNPDMQNKLLHYPYIEARNRDFYRWLTACFVHGSWVHLGINMYVFYQFGLAVEDRFLDLFGEVMGRLNFLLLYLLTGVFANIPTFFRHRENQMFRSVGASGAVSGILFVFILFEPWARLGLFFVIPVRAILAAILFLVYSSYASKKSNDMIDHEAHFYGAVFGFLFTVALKPGLLAEFTAEIVNGWPY
jgi:membrane associated rhomboid family serine protease